MHINKFTTGSLASLTFVFFPSGNIENHKSTLPFLKFTATYFNNLLYVSFHVRYLASISYRCRQAGKNLLGPFFFLFPMQSFVLKKYQRFVILLSKMLQIIETEQNESRQSLLVLQNLSWVGAQRVTFPLEKTTQTMQDKMLPCWYKLVCLLG